MAFIRLTSSSASASGTWRMRNASLRHIRDSYAITFSSTLAKTCDGSIRTCTRCLQGIKKCVNHFPFYFIPLAFAWLTLLCVHFPNYLMPYAFAWLTPICIQHGQFTHCCDVKNSVLYKCKPNPFLPNSCMCILSQSAVSVLMIAEHQVTLSDRQLLM